VAPLIPPVCRLLLTTRAQAAAVAPRCVVLLSLAMSGKPVAVVAVVAVAVEPGRRHRVASTRQAAPVVLVETPDVSSEPISKGVTTHGRVNIS
jgi:hypothetical protein